MRQQVVGFADEKGYTWLTVTNGVITKAQTERGDDIAITIAHVHAVAYYNAVKEDTRG